jgi:hypothetical protein
VGLHKLARHRGLDLGGEPPPRRNHGGGELASACVLDNGVRLL